MRYNASTITINKSEPGDEFEDVQDVIVIYISEFDMFGAGKTVYHVENVIKETGNPVNDGLMSVYVNTEVADDSLISDLMQCFLKTDFKDDKFPNISRRMKELKHGEEDEKMCKSVEEYAERKAKEAAKEAAKKATEEAVKKAMAEKKKTVEKLNDMGMDISLIASAVDMDEETIKQWLEK